MLNDLPANGGRRAAIGQAAPPQGQAPLPQLFEWDVYITAPNNDGSKPLARIQATDVRAATLMFLAGVLGDLSQLRGLRIAKAVSGLIIPG